jgi:N-acetyl sugar amidotransferase
MTHAAYRLCARCVMDTSDLEIRFDERGNCNHCTDYLETRAAYVYHGEKSDRALERTLDEIKRSGAGKPFDCIVGVSGGIDSSYVAYLTKKNGLRALAVHMDNGWDSEEAVTNIKNVINNLGIEYESYVLNWEELKGLQLAFLKASVPEAETPTDMAIVGALHHLAAKYGVKYIISGGNQATEGILPKSWHYNARDLRYFNYITRTFGDTSVSTFPTFSYKTEIFYKFFKGIQTFYLLNYVPYEREVATTLLKDQFDFRFYGDKHYESRYTRFIQSYYLFKKFGIDYRRAHLSTDICNERCGRAEALAILTDKPYDPATLEQEKEYIAKKLGVCKNEFEHILNLPPKWYWDYPNDDRKLGILYSTYRKLFNKEKLASV